MFNFELERDYEKRNIGVILSELTSIGHLATSDLKRLNVINWQAAVQNWSVWS